MLKFDYQLDFIYSFDGYYNPHKNKIKNINKLYYGSQDGPQIIKEYTNIEKYIFPKN